MRIRALTTHAHLVQETLMFRPSITRRLFALASVAATAACSDSIPTSPTPAGVAPAAFTEESLSEGRGVFHRYVSIGTSVSMGWASDGVRAESQQASWPAQLARMAH